MKINEQIVFLRKQKNMTQEQLATVLGVTNQSVSKWESGQCCPDIALLPDIAGYFGVSIDELMGVETAKKDNKRTSDEDENMYDRMNNPPMLIQAFLIATNEGGVSTSILQRRLLIGYDRAKALVEELIALGFVEEQNKNGWHRATIKQGILAPLAYDMQTGITSKIKNLPLVDARRFMLAMAFSGHVSYFYATQNAVENVDSAVEAALGGQWGYSAISEPELTTVMRGQSVFYSKNTDLDFNDGRIMRTCNLLKIFADRKNLTILSALYELTVCTEDMYATVDDIAQKCDMTVSTILDCLENDLLAYVKAKGDGWRICGENMAILPILSILCY